MTCILYNFSSVHMLKLRSFTFQRSYLSDMITAVGMTLRPGSWEHQWGQGGAGGMSPTVQIPIQFQHPEVSQLVQIQNVSLWGAKIAECLKGMASACSRPISVHRVIDGGRRTELHKFFLWYFQGLHGPKHTETPTLYTQMKRKIFVNVKDIFPLNLFPHQYREIVVF